MNQMNGGLAVVMIIRTVHTLGGSPHGTTIVLATALQPGWKREGILVPIFVL